MLMIENKFTRSDAIEAERIRRWKANKDMKGTPKWIVPEVIPTAYHAHQLAKEMNIEISGTDVIENMEGWKCVVCYLKFQGEIFVGSGMHTEELCAKMFAYRNAITDVLKAHKGEGV